MQNNELQLAWNFVNQTKRHIFLTGKAGTGKTTFLHRLKAESNKRLAVVAPTGVAAINARGVTIHSFFQVPFGPVIPGETQQQIKRDFKHKFSKKKIDIIKSLDLLIIDEISMVRADLLDAIDFSLRKYKDRRKVFGGTQVLMIGDLQQLAPVVKPNEWELLKKHYETPYFFSSHAFQQANAISIELKNIYRQEDETFIKILNEIRHNRLSDESARLLNSRYIPDFVPPDDEDYILLTTHNYKAEKINREKLKALPDKTFYAHAYIEGRFPENAYPNAEKLALKKGAQVMFIKNDSSFEKRYYNGKIGKITFIDDKNIFVKCPEDDTEIDVKRETWENITYTINPDTKQIEEKSQGSFSQIPLKLSWAITIHKSQGLTFDKAVIDAELSFAHGQTYVALSRCKTLDGLVLKSPIQSSSIINDRRVTGFTNNIAAQQPDETDLQQAKKQFFIDLIAELFDYIPLLYPTNRLIDIYQKNLRSIQGNVKEPLQNLKELVSPLIDIQKKFQNQIKKLSIDIEDPQTDTHIQERLSKARAYFLQQTKTIKDNFKTLNFDIENKQIQKDFEKFYNDLSQQLHQKLFILTELDQDFSIENYLDIRAKAILEKTEKPKKTKTMIPDIIIYPDLLDALRNLRSELAYTEEVPPFQIFTQETLYALTENLPVTKKQLKKIHGIGKIRLKKYGEQIIEIIKAYCIANDMPLKEDAPETSKPKSNTKEISLNLFKTGKTIDEIAGIRNLTPNTILGHLAYFLPTKEVSITDLISQERFNEISQIIENNSFESLSELKKIAGDEFDWGELRLVMTYLS